MLAFKADQLFLRDKQLINVSLQGKPPHKRAIIYLKFNKICVLCFDGSHSYFTNNVKCISKHKHSFTTKYVFYVLMVVILILQIMLNVFPNINIVLQQNLCSMF